tara:strand:- start:1116 stop:1331 length:216 start_codon:yes stop_codon:yes gene_type:complete
MYNFDIKKVRQYSTEDLKEHMRLTDAEYRRGSSRKSRVYLGAGNYSVFLRWQKEAAVIEIEIEQRLADRNK